MQEMNRWFAMQNPETAKSMEQVEVDSVLLHFSACPNIRRFIPRIPASLYDGEDVTVPRVSTSMNLIDTLVGASWNFEEIHAGNFPEGLRRLSYTVYGIATDAAVRPTKKLTREPKGTGEYWVVPHRMSMYDIRPSIQAKLSLQLIAQTKTECKLHFVIEVLEDLYLTPSKKLSVGYYALSVGSQAVVNKDRGMAYDLRTIQKDGYLEGINSMKIECL